MSNNTQTNPSSTQTGVGTRIRRAPTPSIIRSRSLTPKYLNFERHRGVFETAHGIGENIRGRTLGAIDNVTTSGPPKSNSRHSSLVDRGRMEVETGMAHIYGYPDPHAANASRNEPGHLPQSNTGTFGNGHTAGTGPGTGYMRTGKNDYDPHGRGYDVDGRAGGGPGGYGTDDEYGQPGAQNFERKQQPVIDGNRDMGSDPSGRDGLSPNRGPPNAGPEVSRSSMSLAGVLTPTQQRIKRDSPPELPPRPQAQATDNDHMYQ